MDSQGIFFSHQRNDQHHAARFHCSCSRPTDSGGDSGRGWRFFLLPWKPRGFEKCTVTGGGELLRTVALSPVLPGGRPERALLAAYTLHPAPLARPPSLAPGGWTPSRCQAVLAVGSGGTSRREKPRGRRGGSPREAWARQSGPPRSRPPVCAQRDGLGHSFPGRRPGQDTGQHRPARFYWR